MDRLMMSLLIERLKAKIKGLFFQSKSHILINDTDDSI